MMGHWAHDGLMDSSTAGTGTRTGVHGSTGSSKIWDSCLGPVQLELAFPPPCHSRSIRLVQFVASTLGLYFYLLPLTSYLSASASIRTYA